MGVSRFHFSTRHIELLLKDDLMRNNRTSHLTRHKLSHTVLGFGIVGNYPSRVFTTTRSLLEL